MMKSSKICCRIFSIFMNNFWKEGEMSVLFLWLCQSGIREAAVLLCHPGRPTSVWIIFLHFTMKKYFNEIFLHMIYCFIESTFIFCITNETANLVFIFKLSNWSTSNGRHKMSTHDQFASGGQPVLATLDPLMRKRFSCGSVLPSKYTNICLNYFPYMF